MHRRSGRLRTLQVAAIIGPHGGALHNQWWMGCDTLTVELLPSTKPDLVVFWEHAAMLGQAYWCVSHNDQVVDISRGYRVRLAAGLVPSQVGAGSPLVHAGMLAQVWCSGATQCNLILLCKGTFCQCLFHVCTPLHCIALHCQACCSILASAASHRRCGRWCTMQFQASSMSPVRGVATCLRGLRGYDSKLIYVFAARCVCRPLVYEAIPGSNHDINVTVSDVVEVLRRQLGVPPSEPTLQESYPWKLPDRRKRRRRLRQKLFR